MSSVLIEKRRQKLRKAIRAEKADALLVTNFTNVTYLTGFTGDDSYLLVTLDDATLLTDGRYEAQLADECPDLPLVVRGVGDKMLPTVAAAVQEAGIARLAVEADSMTLATSAELREVASGVELLSSSGLVELLRQVKDKSEIEATREACTQARRAFEVVRAGLTPDQTEAQVAADLEHQVRRFGGKGLSFDPIVAVGERSALPHASAGMKRFGESPFALFDWGANSGLYVSDFTRMVFLGKPPARLRKIYDVVLEAQLAAIDAIAPGRKCSDIDAVARKIISKAGFGNQFNHGLGHGTGLEIHEGPRFSMNSEDELKPGMIMTVEPGVYFAGFGGVRIEDDILVTRSGHEVLSSVPKAWDDCFVG